MRKYFKKLLSYSIYRKTLLTYSISILIITTLILLSLYSVFMSTIKQNQKDSTQQLLGELVKKVDNLKLEVDNVMSMVTGDSKTLKFIQDINATKKDEYYLFLKLQEIKGYYSYIENISVINFNNSKCIQAIGNYGKGTDNIAYAFTMLEQHKYIDVREILQNKTTQNVVSFVQYLPYHNAMVIEDVNADWFQYSIDDSDSHRDARSVYIIDVDGSAVTNNTRAMIGNQTFYDYFYSIITSEYNQDTQEKNFVYEDKGKGQLVFFSKSPEFGWWFIDVQDYSYFDSRFQKISYLFIGMALVLVFFCSLFSILFFKKIRKPITKLAEQCKDMTGFEDIHEVDELKCLDIAIARGKHEKYVKEGYIKTLYLYNLMVDEQMPLFIPQKELNHLRELYQANYYCVMLLKIHNIDPLEEVVREEEYRIYRYAVCNLSEEIFAKGFICKAIDMGEDLIGVLFFLEKKAITEEFFLCFKQLKEFVEEMFRISVRGSLGLIVDQQKDILISYQKSKQYLEMNHLINREELIDVNNQVSVNYQEKNKKLVESIMEYTEYNFNNPDLSLKSISQIFGLSTTYLGKIFKSIQGEAYSAYIANYRLEKSKLALLETTKTVNDIATEIGFTNSTYFATLFKNTYGMTPTIFRNKHHTY